MKRLFFTFTVLMSITIQAQWTEQSNGTDITTTDKVGIGTTAPLSNAVINGGSVNDVIWPLWVQNSRNSSTVSNYGVGIKLKHSHNGELTKWSGIASIQEGAWANLSGLALFADQVERVRIKNNGNVGIGTTNPTARLDVNGNAIFAGNVNLLNSSLIINPQGGAGSDNFGFKVSETGNNTSKLHLFRRFSFDQNDIDRLVIDYRGYVGIGTSSPTSKLHISNGSSNNTPHAFSDFNVEDDDHGMITIMTPSDKNAYYGFADSDDQFVGGIQYNHSINEMRIRVNNHSSDLIIKSNGNVGIGTTTTGTHKLAVEGTIGAREIKVEATGWSDFVFYNDYNLPSLEEVEKYIDQNNHLPEIPSEAEVLEEGINLGEMNAKLLQKIEELTLYLIEQNKELQTQNERIKTLEEKLIGKE